MAKAKATNRSPSQLIVFLDDQLQRRNFTVDELNALVDEFEKSQTLFDYDSQESKIADTYEFNGLIQYAQADYADAYRNFTEALKFIDNGQSLYSRNAASWYYEMRQHILKQQKSKKIHNVVKLSFAIIFFTWIGISSWYNSDDAVLARADPYMMSLADSASMTMKAKVIFAKSDPVLVDSSTMQSVCANSDVSGDSVEAGCFDPNSGKIYIRDLPSDLDQGEITAAAHEMLHAAMSQEGMNDSEVAALNTNIADSNTGAAINTLLASYGEMSDSTRQDETQAFLGTTYRQLTPEMESYYSKYFSDGRQAILNAYDAVETVFNTRKQALAVEQQNIQTTYNNAEIYYSNHAYYARTGNRYGYENAYNQYVQTYNSYSHQVDQYNIDVRNYNELLAGYAGVPLSQLETKKIAN